MKHCTEEHPCSRPDADGWVYEYWADEGGEHKGRHLRAWRMSMWACPDPLCRAEVSTLGTPPTHVCPSCGTNMVFQKHVVLKGGQGEDSRVDDRRLKEKKHLQAIMDAISLASIEMLDFKPRSVSDGGTLTFKDRMALQNCWTDIINIQKRLLKIRTRQGWDG